VASKKSAPPPASKAPSALAKPSITPTEILKNLGIRLGLPLLGVWLLAAWLRNVWVFGVVGALTLAALGITFWAWRRIEKTKRVADVLGNVDVKDKDSRKAALDRLGTDFKDGDVAATFAKAQLLMQDDPDKALEELEKIDLGKVLPAEADQARFQRALIHLTKGEVDKAKQLVDPIDLSKQEDVKSRAMMAAVVTETWGRTGQAKKAMETLDLYNPDDPEFADIKAQLWRARAFIAASLSDTKQIKRALRKLAADNPQYLGVFLQKRVHPLLEREAKQMLQQSGQMRPKVSYQRR
jgi:tetratricopeptide (TPR) repeat protein